MRHLVSYVIYNWYQMLAKKVKLHKSHKNQELNIDNLYLSNNVHNSFVDTHYDN